MKRHFAPEILLVVALVLSWLCLGACSGGSRGPYEYDWEGLIPGPGEPGFDAELEAVARQRDRQFHVFHTLPTGLNAEAIIAADKTSERQAIVDFLEQDDGWDFEAFSGLRVTDALDGWRKVAGGYGGAGVAADAFRYGTLRDQRYPAEVVDRAREQLLRSLEGLARVVEITGEPGVIARGLANTAYGGSVHSYTTVPLFDDQGQPLPEEKNNGTWREDNSGLHPDFYWEDSCSRDMLIGWATAFGGAWEVIADDGTIPDGVKQRLRQQAGAMLTEYMRVRASGYDLEVPDADGRITFHGYLNENNLDRIYMDGIRNGFHTIMALGIISALADVVDDPEVDRYLEQELVEEREFAQIASENTLVVNLDRTTNFSNYNMAISGAWLATRHLRHTQGRRDVELCLERELYDTPDADFQPVEQGQTFFDFTYAAGMCGAAAGEGCSRDLDEAAVARGVATLRAFPRPPFFAFSKENCDADEIASGHCVADDGVTELTILGPVGWNDEVIAAEPLPMALRPASNYYWRSNPYRVNDEASENLMYAGPDFRLAYWMGRWIRR